MSDETWQLGDVVVDVNGDVWQALSVTDEGTARSVNSRVSPSVNRVLWFEPGMTDPYTTEQLQSRRGPLTRVETRPWRWLESTRELQEQFFGHEFPMSGTTLADYVLMNHSAAVIELSEMMEELRWKPWATPRGEVAREKFIGEGVDVLHFIGNMLVAVGCTGEELERRYREKQEVNRERQRKGYDARNKCPHCRRAYDDLGVECTRGESPKDSKWAWCMQVRSYVDPVTGEVTSGQDR